MTSPVDTSVKFFRSAMSGAPVVNGVAGSLVAMLTACLVDGFDTKSLTSLVASGGVMTATFTGTHSSEQDAVVLVAGVTGGPSGFAGANGEQKVVAAPTPTTRTWATALPDGTYTGTITMKMAPLGWARSFTGTNKAVYRSTDPASTGMYLRVDDTGTTSARVVGYESMTDVDTGLAPFPSALQMSGGGYWPKSSAANATANLWCLIGDGRYFYVWNAIGSGANPTYIAGLTRGFGDLLPLKPGGDAFACTLSYSAIASVLGMSDGDLAASGASPAITQAVARNHTGLGGSQVGYIVPYSGSASLVSGNDLTLGAFPSEVDGSIKFSKKYYAPLLNSVAPRADYPGILHQPQTGSRTVFVGFEAIPGTDAYAGRRLMNLSAAGSSTSSAPTLTNGGNIWFDRTGPWRS